MTYQEAIETLKANYPDACFGQLREAVDKAISALQRVEMLDELERRGLNEVRAQRISKDILTDWSLRDD